MKDEWNRASTDDLAKAILGPLARTWKDKETGRITLGLQKGDKKIILGSGDSYHRAFENVFIDPKKAFEALDESSPGWREGIETMKKAQNAK